MYELVVQNLFLVTRKIEIFCISSTSTKPLEFMETFSVMQEFSKTKGLQNNA